MRKFGAIVFGAGILFTGCATTDAPEDLGKLQYTGFTQKSDGSAYQSVMGLSCPPEIDGIPRTSTKVFRENGTDVSCNYSGDERIFTVYLSRFSGDSLATNFQTTQSTLDSLLPPRGFTYDQKLSDDCSAQSLDESSLLAGLSGLLSGANTSNEITLSPTPSAVYIDASEGKMSLVTIDEMFEKDFFKTRYTGPYRSSGDVEKICKSIGGNYLNMKSSVGKNRGLEVSDSEKLLDFINRAGDSS